MTRFEDNKHFARPICPEDGGIPEGLGEVGPRDLVSIVVTKFDRKGTKAAVFTIPAVFIEVSDNANDISVDYVPELSF